LPEKIKLKYMGIGLLSDGFVGKTNLPKDLPHVLPEINNFFHKDLLWKIRQKQSMLKKGLINLI